ncbi:MAG TPA: MoaD/ThiS family protein [Acidiferrobacteraceae bacterium]|nr:MoaD/ThiS family protein [Acidiferrobacteraceae bacterium]
MSIKVRYFASLREKMGREEDQLDALGVNTVADVWTRAARGQAMPPNTLAAVNLEYGDLTTSVADGDEVAFFPPVTGG